MRIKTRTAERKLEALVKTAIGNINCAAADKPNCPTTETFLDSKQRIVTVRKYADEDLEQLRHMYETYMPKGKANGLPPVKREVRDKWICDAVKDGMGFLACIEGRIVGHGILFPLPCGDRAEYGIFVHQDFHSNKIGTHLTQITICHAIAAGFKGLWLIVEPRNKSAIALYKKAGFCFEGEIDVEACMTLDLENK